MIKKIDIYLLKKFISIFIMVLISVLTVFIIIDFVENVNQFLESPNYSVWLIVRFYTVYVPNIIYLVMPVIVLISSLFSMMSMARYNEIIVLKSSGLSLARIILPLLVVGIFLSLGMIAFGEYVVPLANQKRIDMKNFEIKGHRKVQSQRINNKFFQDDDGNKIYISEYDYTRNFGKNIYLQKVVSSKLIKRIDGRKFKWENGTWFLTDVTVRDFLTTPYTFTQFDTLRILIAGIDPEELLREKHRPDEMNYAELSEFVDDLRRMGLKTTFWEVARNSKLSYPFASLIIIIFGATLAANKRRSGPALGFLIALTIIFVYYFIFKFSEIFGQNGEIAPLLASWMANILFGIAGVFSLYKSNR